jgi:hypothetical protein
MNRHQRVLMLVALLTISAVMLGCANNSRVENSRAEIADGDVQPSYESDLMRARTSIADAERSGAAEFANPELTVAREKIRAAERALEDDEIERARRLAAEAVLDADLAVAITRHRQTEQLAAEVRSGLQTLEQELQRDADAGLARP